LPDVQCGFIAIRGDVAPLLLGWSKGYPWACEMLIKAEALNLKMASAPIATIKPEGSHIKPLTETLRFLNMLLRRRKTQRRGKRNVIASCEACELFESKRDTYG
jgi:hypothetical protein